MRVFYFNPCPVYFTHAGFPFLTDPLIPLLLPPVCWMATAPGPVLSPYVFHIQHSLKCQVKSAAQFSAVYIPDNDRQKPHNGIITTFEVSIDGLSFTGMGFCLVSSSGCVQLGSAL